MNLRDASIDDISMELSRRDQPFFLILANPDNPEAQFHCCAIPPKVVISLFENGAKIMKTIIEGGKIPENCKISRRLVKDGKIIDEVEITEGNDLLEDPWAIENKNKIGDFNPWKEVNNEFEEIDSPKEEKEEEIEPETDPWNK
jgi:hypothetical protein